MTTTVSPSESQTSAYHADFLRHGRYLRGWSDRTLRTYQQGLTTLGHTPLTKGGSAAWVVAQRERGLTRSGVNMYASTINSFLSWMHEEGHLRERLRISLLPNPPKAITGISDQEVTRIVSFRPKDRFETRTWVLLMVLLDTGLRITEALTLQRAHVALDDQVLRVLGKGHRERLVPISVECRKALFRQMARTETPLVFATGSGKPMSYRNAYRDIKVLCAALGVSGRHVHPHAFRHCFAASYVRRGGDLYRLSRILGHSTISTTQLYLRSMGIEQLREGHEQFSPLTPRSATSGPGSRR